MEQGSQPQPEYDRGNLHPNGKTPDRMKRDEWSEGAVGTLLDAYEAKWVLRNRAKLKGNDWEEVARQVCARNGGSRPFKTQSQCKNKIEALKKRYRSEATNMNTPGSGPSTWSFFTRIDLLLRCPAAATAGPGYGEAGGQPVVTELGLQEALPQVESGDSEQVVKRRREEVQIPPEFLARNPRVAVAGGANANHHQPQQLQQQQQQHHHHLQESSQEDASNTLPPPQRKDSGSDTSTPRSKIAHAQDGSGKTAAAKRRKNSSSEVAESIRSFADSILKLEQAKMEMYKDSERLRAEAEARRVEMELKRTEIIAKTQLEIAKLLSGKPTGRRKIANNSNNSNSTNATSTMKPPPPSASAMNGGGGGGGGGGGAQFRQQE